MDVVEVLAVAQVVVEAAEDDEVTPEQDHPVTGAGGGTPCGAESEITRVVKVPFEMELSSVPVPKNRWNCWNFSVHSSFPINKILVKLELNSIQVPKSGWNCRNLVP